MPTKSSIALRARLSLPGVCSQIVNIRTFIFVHVFFSLLVSIAARGLCVCVPLFCGRMWAYVLGMCPRLQRHRFSIQQSAFCTRVLPTYMRCLIFCAVFLREGALILLVRFGTMHAFGTQTSFCLLIRKTIAHVHRERAYVAIGALSARARNWHHPFVTTPLRRRPRTPRRALHPKMPRHYPGAKYE